MVSCPKASHLKTNWDLVFCKTRNRKPRLQYFFAILQVKIQSDAWKIARIFMLLTPKTANFADKNILNGEGVYALISDNICRALTWMSAGLLFKRANTMAPSIVAR